MPDSVNVPRESLATLDDDLDGACTFWACPGPDAPYVHMATCRVCAARQDIRRLLGYDVPDPAA